MKRGFRAFALLLGCAGIALFVAGFLDLADLARRHSPDGEVSAEFLRAVAIRSRICGVITLAIAASLPLLWSGGHPSAGTRDGELKVAVPWIAGLIVLIGAVARALLLDAPLHWDEAFTFNELVARPPYDFLSRYSHPNNHVFHTTLAWVASTIGDAKWVLRLPAFLAGIGVLAATFVVARRLFGRNTALVATAFAAGASPLVEASAQGRGYTLVTLATLLLFAIPRERWLLAATIAAFGAWTIPVMIYPFAAYLVWLLLHRTPIVDVVRVAGMTAALAFLLYVPILIVSGPASITDNGNVQPLPFGEFARALPPSMSTMWQGWMRGVPAILGIALVVAAVVGIARHAEARMLAIAVVAGIAPLLLLTRVLPFPRVWIFLVPLFLSVVASGAVSERWPRATAGIASIALAAILAWNAIRVTQRPDFFESPAMRDTPEIAAFVRKALPPDTSLLAVQPLDAPLAFELHDPRLVQQRFDTDPDALRAALASRPHTWTLAVPGETRSGNVRLVRAFAHSELWEIR